MADSLGARMAVSRPNQRPLMEWQVPQPGDWRDRGACLGKGLHRWFPKGEQGRGMLRTERELLAVARDVCAACPVKQECLDYGVRWWRDLWGVWGGHTRTERRKLWNLRRQELAS